MDTTQLKTMGSRMRFARQLNKLTLQALADKVGVTRQAVHNLEVGKAQQTNKLFNFADTLNVNVEWLARGNGPMTRDADYPLTNGARGQPKDLNMSNLHDVLASIQHRLTVLESRLAHAT